MANLTRLGPKQNIILKYLFCLSRSDGKVKKNHLTRLSIQEEEQTWPRKKQPTNPTSTTGKFLKLNLNNDLLFRLCIVRKREN